ncbi:MAG: hypothetical protein HRU46_20465 [Verrucomicrobiales bacterium]|nr:hypothetical protein [Verrucomicrobiales bacterium]
MSRRAKRKWMWGLAAALLIYVSLYFYLRPLGKVSRWKNPVTGKVSLSMLVFPLDPAVIVKGRPFSIRTVADAVYKPVRAVDEVITGKSIRFSSFELVRMDRKPATHRKSP